ncbi:hypothetical protein BRC77_13155 [Halobacteriales archaeon QH_8_64_26]|nr:MAG: hypothetical protein BRC77_13155 [Halobacteriales archaeon QH_8_64_26]
MDKQSRTETEESNCKCCERNKSHEVRGLDHGDYQGGLIVICPNAPAVGTDQSLCDDCETDLVGERAPLVTTEDPADPLPR